MLVSIEDAVKRSYDYIIVGGGTAGLTLAARLSEDASVSVLVLESGISHVDDVNITGPPSREVLFGNRSYTWDHRTTEQQHASHRVFAWNRGKGLGGSSSVNFTMWTKPSRDDIDDIERLGNPGWNWDNYQLYSARAEGFVDPPVEVQNKLKLDCDSWKIGRTGPMQLSYPTRVDDADIQLQQTFYNAGLSDALEPMSGDPNGVFFAPACYDRESQTRYSATKAYYLPCQTRANLTVVVSAHVSRVLISDGEIITATGVEIAHGGGVHTIHADREVIISAGSLHSPQILELSGIGRQDVLRSVGIPLRLELPGVGENVQEHISLRVNWRLKDSVKDNDVKFWCFAFAFLSLGDITEDAEAIYRKAKDLSSEASGATDPLLRGRFVQYELQARRVDPGAHRPSVELIFIPPYGAFGDSTPGDRRVGFSIVLNHCFSRGSIHATSSDATQPAQFDPRYFEQDIDLDVYVAAVKYVRKLAEVAPLKDAIEFETQPSTDVQTDSQLREWVKASFRTTWHTAGSCSMLPRDKGGVVNPTLKVHGTTNLRVVDLSIVPLHFVGHAQSTVYAIAEQAAAIIEGETNDEGDDRA